jgi:hypothetical protein
MKCEIQARLGTDHLTFPQAGSGHYEYAPAYLYCTQHACELPANQPNNSATRCMVGRVEDMIEASEKRILACVASKNVE